MWTVEPLVLSVEERAELEGRVRAQTTAHRDRQRAEVVLLAAEGLPGTQVASRVDMSQQSVCKWRQRFRDRGLEGLVDAPRSGRPLVYGPTDRLVCRDTSATSSPSSAVTGGCVEDGWTVGPDGWRSQCEISMLEMGLETPARSWLAREAGDRENGRCQVRWS